MKKFFSLSVLLMTILTLTACKNDKSEQLLEESSNTQNKKISSVNSEPILAESSELASTSNSKQDKVEQLSASDFKTTIKAFDKAVILAGDPMNSQFLEKLAELRNACDEASIDLYQVDLTSQEGKHLQSEYQFSSICDFLLVIEGNLRKVELSGGSSIDSDILEKLFTIYK